MNGTSLRRTKVSHGGEGGHGEAGGERWLLTYADMITLLLVLFIVLFAIATVNQAKYQEFKQSVSQALLSHVPHGSTNLKTTTSSASQANSSQSSASTQSSAATQSTQLAQIQQQLESALSSQGLLGDVKVSMQSAGLVLGLVTDSTFFGTDSADLTQIGRQIVDTASSVVKKYPNAIQVAGYTDNEPITGGPYASNWALSAARATTVVVRMTKTDGVNPSQVALIGYGQYHPLVPNSSPSAQAQNRRVNIVVSPTASFKS